MTATAQDPKEARLADRPRSVGAMFVDQVKASGPKESFRYLDGERWVSLTWNELKMTSSVWPCSTITPCSITSTRSAR
jgi:hypothetical protein